MHTIHKRSQMAKELEEMDKATEGGIKKKNITLKDVSKVDYIMPLLDPSFTD